jgi:predicted Rossmann fold nucleotide-binding protein DprA/Smf involved in DNA uptake
MLFGLTARRRTKGPTLGAVEAAVWDALEAGSATVDTLANRSGLPPRQTLEGVARLELNGMVRLGVGGEVERVSVG